MHPKNDAINLPRSLALATVDIGKQGYQHKLEQTGVHHILQSQGRMLVESEMYNVVAGDVVVIPERSLHWIENIGNELLVFAAIVSPPWAEDGDVRIEQRNESAWVRR